MTRSPSLIDVHTHIYPDAIANKAAQSVRKFYELDGTSLDGTVSTLLRHGEQAGIDKFVVLPVALTPERTRHINDYILSQTAAEPRFLGFGTVHAEQENLTDEVQYILDHGLHGVKMHPDSQVFPIDDPRLFPMYEMLEGKHPVILHIGDPRYDYSHPARLRKVIDNFPRLQVVAAHFGGYQLYEIAADLLKDAENCFFDTSSSLMFMEPGTPERLINLYGAERFMYGTDYPMWDPVEEVRNFLNLKLTANQKEQIAHKTAEALFGL